MKKNKKKWKINEDIVLRNIAVISSVISIVLLIHKIATCGIGFISTIRYFN